MRTMILRPVCDTCGFIAQFETLNSEPPFATTPTSSPWSFK